MILNDVVTVQNGQTGVTFVSGDDWKTVMLPAFMGLTGPNVDPTKFWIAALDTGNGQWLQLATPWPGPSSTALPVIIYSDFTPSLNLPLANPGDVDLSDIWNRSMAIMDSTTTANGVPLHGPTHIGTGMDPVPLASPEASGALCQLSGLGTDYVGGDNQCHALSGLPTGSVIMWPIKTLPANFLALDGGQYSRTTYANLYAFLGGALSPWGQGDGKYTFNTPDMRGRVPMGPGTGPGLSTRAIGQLIGEETHLLTVNELPSMSYSYIYDGWSSTGGTLGFVSGPYKLNLGKTGTTNTQGGKAPFNVIQPSLVMQFIIRV